MIPQNSAHWHLVLNHFPIVGTILGILLLLVMFTQSSKGYEYLALWWFVLIAVLAIPVYLTGEPAEELIEGMAGVSHDAIEHHETLAMWAFALQELTGLFAFGVLLYRNLIGDPGTWIRPTLLGLVLITAGLMGYTAALGGHIHHSETRSGFASGDEEHEEHEKEEASSRSYPGSVELDSKFRTILQNEMRQIDAGMNQLLTQLVRGQRTEAAQTATQIHNSFILKQELPAAELNELQNQLPDGFVKLDQAFHQTAAELAESVKKGRMEDAIKQYHRMTSSCFTCHSRYARERFSGLETEETNRKDE